MVNRSGISNSSNKPLAVIPDEQISRLKFMLGQSDVSVDFMPSIFKVNDNVRVIRGYFKGLAGEIMKNSDGTNTLVVSISILGGLL